MRINENYRTREDEMWDGLYRRAYLLVRIGRLFKDADFRSHLMDAEIAHEMYEVLAAKDAD